MAAHSQGAGPSPAALSLKEILKSENAEAFDDDDEDLDDEFADLQRIQSAKRREARDMANKCRIRELLRIPFAPNIRPLGIYDIDSVVALEHAAFHNPEHQASRKKMEYRLSICPQLSMGIFLTVPPDRVEDTSIFATFDTAHLVETGRPDNAKTVLLAHIVGTASDSDIVTDKAMEVPGNWKGPKRSESDKGHLLDGRTVCLHSLAVSPKLQGCELGKLIMKSFLQHVKNIGYERVALICQEYLIGYYERFGFKNVGKSKVEFAGGGWVDMVFDWATHSAAVTTNTVSS
ncbi:hypothetical protein BD289DRAFT_449932 [Coniella lustricola]|uniref:N-acetyltransferase domain-containing protein n=1 Tax=Coniella lustricola TaxID=2025994 RepID=A0A2T3AKM0_9PEZI|nr:hypothetical protein BD289DRAFT_449932 [Coniella lustricola]